MNYLSKTFRSVNIDPEDNEKTCPYLINSTRRHRGYNFKNIDCVHERVGKSWDRRHTAPVQQTSFSWTGEEKRKYLVRAPNCRGDFYEALWPRRTLA